MNRYTFSLIILIVSFQLSAQIELIDSLEQNILHQTVFATDAGLKFCHLDQSTSTLTIYNEDFSLYKELALEISKGYNVVNVLYLSRGLFDLDEELEFLYYESNGLKANTRIINEDGSIIQSFEKSDAPAIYKGKNSAILVLRSGKFDSETKRTVFKAKYYTLPGNLDTLAPQ